MLGVELASVSRSFQVFEPSDQIFHERNCAQKSFNSRRTLKNNLKSRLAQAQQISFLRIAASHGRRTECSLVGSRIAEISSFYKHSLNVNTIRIERCNSSLLRGDVSIPRSSDTRRVISAPAIKINRSEGEVPVTEEIDDESDDICHVGCVREIFSKQELEHALEAAKRRNAVVVLDFYKTACGSCKYIEHGFAKLCRGEAVKQHPVTFLKHNVMNEYEEESDLAEEFRIKVVPLFYFYRDGVLVAKFPTREKAKILEAIDKYSSFTYEHVSTDDTVPKIPERNR